MQRLGRQVEDHTLLQNHGLNSRVDAVVPQGMDAQDEADGPDSGSELDAEEEALGVSPGDSEEAEEMGVVDPVQRGREREVLCVWCVPAARLERFVFAARDHG